MLHDFTHGGATQRGTPVYNGTPGVLRGASCIHVSGTTVSALLDF